MPLYSSDFSSGSDRWLAAAPVGSFTIGIGLLNGDFINVYDFTDPIFAARPTFEVFDLHAQKPTDPQKKILVDRCNPQDINNSGNASVLDARLRAYTFEGAQGQVDFVEPYPSYHLEIYDLREQGISSNQIWDLVGFIPLTWHELDVAELLVAWTRHHSGGGAAALALLDQTSLIAYSERLLDVRYRQRLTVWREEDRSIAEQVREIVRQTNAIVGFGVHDGANGLNLNLTLREFDDLAENTAIYTADPGRDSFFVARPSVRFADDQIANRVAFPYGRATKIAGLAQESLVQISNMAPANSQAADGKIRQEIASSISELGLRELNRPAALNFYNPQWAEGSLDLVRWSDLRREVSFAMGPLHFDFVDGDVIHVADEFLGLSGLEDFVVTKKKILWNTIFANVTALEVNRNIGVSIAPDELDADDTSPTLRYWFKGDAGIFLGASPNIGTWTNQASAYPDLLAPIAGTATPAEKLTAYRNGRDAVSFRKDVSVPRALRLVDTSGETSWTFAICGEFFHNSSIQFLFDSPGGASGPLRIKVPNSINGRWAYNDGGSDGLGPQTLGTRDGILLVQLWRTVANYANAGDLRVFMQWHDFASGDVVTYDDYQTARYLENSISGDDFGSAGDKFNGAKLRGFAGTTAFGSNVSFDANAGDYNLFEIAGYSHAKGERQLRAHELSGLVRYLEARWK